MVGSAEVTWGNPAYGGDSSQVQEQLTRVQEIRATDRAFAAIKDDGKVVTWGDARKGGDSSHVQDQLTQARGIATCNKQTNPVYCFLIARVPVSAR